MTDAGSRIVCERPDAGATLDAFADRVVSFTPGGFPAGIDAGFGDPCAVLGPPRGQGTGSGSLDVVSFGNDGVLVLEFTDLVPVDGPGVDLLVFENPFGPFMETAHVALSEDGVTFHEFPCDPVARDAGFPGCAGVRPVLSSPDNGIEPTDPAAAGGDGFDLATLGLARARFVRLRDSGLNPGFGGNTVGFDLDAVAVVNGQPLDAGAP